MYQKIITILIDKPIIHDHKFLSFKCEKIYIEAQKCIKENVRTFFLNCCSHFLFSENVTLAKSTHL